MGCTLKVRLARARAGRIRRPWLLKSVCKVGDVARTHARTRGGRSGSFRPPSPGLFPWMLPRANNL